MNLCCYQHLVLIIGLFQGQVLNLVNGSDVIQSVGYFGLLDGLLILNQILIYENKI